MDNGSKPDNEIKYDLDDQINPLKEETTHSEDPDLVGGIAKVPDDLIVDNAVNSLDADKTIIVGKAEEIKDASVNADEKDNDEMAKGKKVKKPKVYKNGFNWVFWICILIILIPCCIFVGILLKASQATNTPILGNRFVGDLTPAVTEEDMSGVEVAIKALDGVENCSAETKVATTRILVDVKDDITKEEMTALVDLVYQTLDGRLPIATYYTNTETATMYDLEINIYNNLEFDKTSEIPFMMYSVIKNAKMENYMISNVSTPLNSELAAQLLQDVIDRDNPKEVTSEDGEQQTEEE